MMMRRESAMMPSAPRDASSPLPRLFEPAYAAID